MQGGFPKVFIAIGLAGLMATTSAQAGTFDDVLASMDSSTAGYKTQACADARTSAANFDENAISGVREGVALGASYYFFGVMGIAAALAQKERMRNLALDRLAEGCGAETFLPYVQSKSLENDDKTQAWIGLGYQSEQEWPQAIAWYQKAFDQDNADAAARLATIYYDGDGVPQDYAHALTLLQRAVDLGSIDALTQLGQIYYDGKAAPQDKSRAFDLYRRAARHGNVKAQMLVAGMYERGEGARPSKPQAYKWYNIAAKSGSADAISKRDALGAEMAQDQVYQANAETLKCRSAILQCE